LENDEKFEAKEILLFYDRAGKVSSFTEFDLKIKIARFSRAPRLT